MDTSCPHCGAAYRVPDTLLTPGQPLRCAACGGDWVPIALPAPPAPEPAEAPAEAMDEPALPLPRANSTPAADPPPLVRRREPGPRLLPLAWAGSLVLLGLGVVALLVWRAPLVAAWPPLARLLGG